MTETGYDIPSHLDTPRMREMIQSRFIPVIGRSMKLATVDHHWFPPEAEFKKSLEVMTVGTPQADIPVARATAHVRRGNMHWTGSAMAYESNGKQQAEVVVQQALESGAGNVDSEVVISKVFDATVSGPMLVSLDITKISCVVSVREGPLQRGIVIAIEGTGKKKPFVARVKNISGPPFHETGDLFWYDGMGMKSGHSGHGALPGTLTEQTVMALDFDSVDSLLDKLNPAGPMSNISDRSSFFRVLTDSLRTSSSYTFPG
jgi:hypothetical protein